MIPFVFIKQETIKGTTVNTLMSCALENMRGLIPREEGCMLYIRRDKEGGGYESVQLFCPVPARMMYLIWAACMSPEADPEKVYDINVACLAKLDAKANAPDPTP